MALTKFNSTPPPQNAAGTRQWANEQFIQVDRSIADLLALLVNLNGAKIQVGAPDSAGLGFRVLRIPN